MPKRESRPAGDGAGPGAGRDPILDGPIIRALLTLAWPTATTAALHGLVAAVDVIMVGRLGEAAVAAVTTCRQALMVVLVGGSAVAAGAGTLVSQAIGRGDKAEADHVITQALLSFLVVVTLVLTPFAWYSAPWLLRRLAEDPEVVALGVPYLRVVICSLVFTMTSFAAGGALRGAGDPKTPLKLTLLGNGINVVGNYAFIFGVPFLGIPAMGVVGAAVGTVIARGVTNALLWYWLFRGELVIGLEPIRRWVVDLDVLRRVLTVGIPTSASAVALNVYGIVVIGILARTPPGRLAVAAYGLSMVLRNFATWVTWGLSEATMAMVGQNVGADQKDRAASTGVMAAKVSAGFMLLVGALMASIAPVVLPLIINEPDPQRKAQVVSIGVIYLVTQVVGLPFLGVGMSMRGALRGVGDTVTPLVINIVCLGLIGLPGCSLLALDQVWIDGLAIPGRHWGPLGVWVGMVAAMACNGTLCHLYWRSGRWRRFRV